RGKIGILPTDLFVGLRYCQTMIWSPEESDLPMNRSRLARAEQRLTAQHERVARLRAKGGNRTVLKPAKKQLRTFKGTGEVMRFRLNVSEAIAAVRRRRLDR